MLLLLFLGLLFLDAREQPYWTLAAAEENAVSQPAYTLNPYDTPLPEIQQDKIQVACIGDSITYGAGVMDTRKTQSYPAYLQQLLGEDSQVINYGLGGRTLVSTGDWPYCEEEYYRSSIQQPADIYLIMLGTNDAKPMNWDKERYLTELRAMVETYQKLDTSPQVYLVTPPKCFGKVNDETDVDNDIIRKQVLPCIETVAEKTGTKVINIYPMFALHPWWIADYIHPGAKGNQHIAAYIYQQIQ